MKIVVLVLVIVALLSAFSSPIFAWGLSPDEITINVSSNGSCSQEFQVTDLNGSIQVSTSGIPLRVDPNVISVNSSGITRTFNVTIYGNESLGTQIFKGTINFLPVTSNSVVVGIKVLTTVNQIRSQSLVTSTATPISTSTVIPIDTMRPSSHNNTLVIAIFIILLCIIVGVIIFLTVRRRI